MAKKSPKKTTFTGKVKKKAQVGLENLTGQGLDITPISSDLLSPIGPIRTYNTKERAEMEKFAKMSPKQKQKYKDTYSGIVPPPSALKPIPYVETDQSGQLPQPQLGQDQTLAASEIQTSVPQSVQEAQKLSKVAEGVEEPRQKARNPFENIKWNDAVQTGLYGVDAFLRKQDAIRNQQNYQRRLRNVFTQKPIYDYNALYGPDSSGGTQYQSLIMAKNGANIRKGTSPNITDVEVEGGEFIQLPDLSTQHVQGPSHAKGGVHTNLPEGSRVFSDYLKPLNSKKTYAQLAKKYDTEKYREVLDNPYANDIDRRTAKLLFNKYESILNELFKDQQKQNGNSDGTDQSLGMEEETMAKFGLDLKKGEKLSFTNPFMFGGYYQEGGEYLLPYEDENNLFQVYNPYNAYNNFDEYAPIANPTTMDNMAEYEGGGQYLGGEAYLNGGGSFYQDGGMFPDDSTFYGATPGDTSILTTGTDVMGSSKFQDGGVYYSPQGKKYKIPKDATVKEEGDKTIKAGDFVKRSDGSIMKVTKVQAKMMAKSTASSSARDYAEGRLFLKGWAQESPENANKLKIAENVIAQAIKAGQIEETKPKGWKEGDPTELIIKGNFKPSFRNRLLISEVINKTGKGFGTDKYRIKLQQPTEGYSGSNKSGNLEKTGSFVGGMTPQDYEQRATYERALIEGKTPEEAEAIATTTDPKQKAENRRKYLGELKYDVSDIPDSALISDDFYKNRYRDVTKAIETSFSESGFRPSIGDDMLSGWEHYDAASYAGNPSYGNIEVEDEPPPGNEYPGVPPFQQTPSTPGRFPMYQAIPEAMGYLSGLNPYSYYTPDYTHTEIAPPTLNLDPQLQSIDDSLLSAIRQSTGNASVDNSRNAALFNQALQAKQQAFANKQNYDANARFQADQYNAQARDLESYRDVSSAAQVYNEYMAAAQDAAERERLSAISNLVKKRAQFDQDEFQKMLYVSALMPNFYYEGTDLRNPLKRNPYAEQFYSKMAGKYPATTSVTPAAPAAPVTTKTPAPQAKTAATPTNVVSPEVAANALNLTPNPLYSWGQPQMNQNMARNFGPTYNMAGYGSTNPNVPVTVVPTPQGPAYVPYEMGIPEINPQDIYMMDEGKMKFGGKTKIKKSK